MHARNCRVPLPCHCRDSPLRWGIYSVFSPLTTVWRGLQNPNQGRLTSHQTARSCGLRRLGVPSHLSLTRPATPHLTGNAAVRPPTRGTHTTRPHPYVGPGLRVTEDKSTPRLDRVGRGRSCRPGRGSPGQEGNSLPVPTVGTGNAHEPVVLAPGLDSNRELSRVKSGTCRPGVKRTLAGASITHLPSPPAGSWLRKLFFATLFLLAHLLLPKHSNQAFHLQDVTHL